MRTITIRIKEDGTIQAEAHGYKGKRCSKDLDYLLAGTGDRKVVKVKPEYYQEETVKETVKGKA